MPYESAPSKAPIDPDFAPYVLNRAVDALLDVVVCVGLPARMRAKAERLSRLLRNEYIKIQHTTDMGRTGPMESSDTVPGSSH